MSCECVNYDVPRKFGGAQVKFSLYSLVKGGCDFFRRSRLCRLSPDRANCSKAVVQPFEFIGELLKKSKSMVSRGTKQQKTGIPGSYVAVLA